MKTTNNPILNLTFDFSIEIINYVDRLQERKKFLMANQMFRSGTSIGANVHEAQGAESRTDFVHKMKIAFKEAEETKYWLLLCLKSNHYPDPGNLLEKLESILRLLSKIISTSKKPLAH